MSNEQSPWLDACPGCGADQWSPESVCWLCGYTPGGAFAHRQAPAASPPRQIAAAKSFSLATLLLLMTLAAVWLGLLATAPGLAIFACILLLPAVVRTAMVVQRRAVAGRGVSPSEKLALGATSLLVSGVVLVVAAVASIGTFCAVCLGVASASNDRGDMSFAFVIAGFAALLTTLVAVRFLARWIRRRYQRDIEGNSL
jgi:hypothetical protein